MFEFTSMFTELNGTEYGGVTDALVLRTYSLPRVVNVSPVSLTGSSAPVGKLVYIG